MLSESFRWRISDVDAFLDYNAGNVAHIQRWRGVLTLTIRWQGKTVGGPVGSIRQGVRWAAAWISARPGWPGKRPRRWYDEVDERRRAAEGLAHRPAAGPPPRRRSPLDRAAGTLRPMDTWTEIEAALRALQARIPELREQYADEGDLRDAFHHLAEPILDRAHAAGYDVWHSASVLACDILIDEGLVDASERQH